MTTATQSSATLMRHKKSELVDEVMALRQQVGELEVARDGPSVAGADTETTGQANGALPLSDAVEHLSAGFALFDSKDRLVLCNSIYRSFYGYTKSDLRPGITITDLLNLDIAREVISKEAGGVEATENRIKRFRAAQDTFEIPLADGRWLQIRDRRTSDGGTVSIHTDVTKLKQAEEALRASEGRLHGAVDCLQGGFALYDAEDRLVLVNDQYTKINPSITEILEQGGTFEDLLRANVAKGMIAEAVGREEEFLRERLARHRNPSAEPIARNHTDGRSYLLREVKTPEGGIVLTYSEITELKRAEEELTEKEAQLRVALDNMAGGMMLLDRDRNYVLFNSQYCELYEYPDGLVRVGGSLRDVIRFQAERGDYGPGDKHDIIEQVLANSERGKARSYEREIAGSGRTLQIYMAPTPEGGYVNIVTDITERKRAEEELAEKEAQLRVALDSMPGGIRYVDEDRNYVFFNSRYLELYEFPKGLLKVGKHCRNENLYQAKRGDFGPGDPEALTDDWLAASERGKTVSYEREIADGGRTLQVYAAPTPEGGYVNIVTDITERKRAEEALEEAHQIIKDQRDRMEDELNIGREIQMSMIPLVFPPFPDHNEFSVFAALEPAREVGGDFYDYYFIDEERLCFSIGDVSGKGVPAALFMAMTKTLIKSRAADDRSTASILTHVNDELSADNKTCMFVTIFAAILNIRTGELVYTSAGHNPPYLKRIDGTLQRLDKRHGPVIGALEGMVYKEDRDNMAPGDLLALFTDGVTEAMDLEDQLFSEDRYAELLGRTESDDPKSMVRNTLAAIETFTDGAEQTDDITILALKFHGTPEDGLMAEQKIVIKNESPEIIAVNEKFETFAEEFNIPPSVAVKFNVIFEELLNNVISYAYTDDDEHDIEVRMERAGKRLTVTITDDGVPFNPLGVERPDTGLPLEDREVGGMGIHLVRNLIDDVSYQRRIDKNVMTMVKHL